MLLVQEHQSRTVVRHGISHLRLKQLYEDRGESKGMNLDKLRKGRNEAERDGERWKKGRGREKEKGEGSG